MLLSRGEFIRLSATGTVGAFVTACVGDPRSYAEIREQESLFGLRALLGVNPFSTDSELQQAMAIKAWSTDWLPKDGVYTSLRNRTGKLKIYYLDSAGYSQMYPQEIPQTMGSYDKQPYDRKQMIVKVSDSRQVHFIGNDSHIQQITNGLERTQIIKDFALDYTRMFGDPPIYPIDIYFVAPNPGLNDNGKIILSSENSLNSHVTIAPREAANTTVLFDKDTKKISGIVIGFNLPSIHYNSELDQLTLRQEVIRAFGNEAGHTNAIVGKDPFHWRGMQVENAMSIFEMLVAWDKKMQPLLLRNPNSLLMADLIEELMILSSRQIPSPDYIPSNPKRSSLNYLEINTRQSV